jgi:hypothetical protein
MNPSHVPQTIYKIQYRTHLSADLVCNDRQVQDEHLATRYRRALIA